jgi:S-DNA-T family DNA segregation ATPase FtsK/SpoIIIE
MKNPTIELYTVDTKQTEFNTYGYLPNVHTVTDANEAVQMFRNLCNKMESRYTTLTNNGCRDIDAYNQKIGGMNRIVVVVDELADLMLLSGKVVEEYIVRLAQKARACGIHLIIATQRPTANVVTGLIKANIPTRVCLKVTSGLDSRIILDRKGGEVLTGHGDMLFLSNGAFEPVRISGCYVSEREIRNIVALIKKHCRTAPQEKRGFMNGIFHRS